MKTVALAATLAAVVLAGCASGPCADGASANNAIANKFASCAISDPGFFGGYSPCFDSNACNENLKSCTAADQKALEVQVACQDAYASNDDCSFAGLTTYDDCAAAATTNGDGGSALTPACAAQFAQNPGLCGGTDAGD